jgi:hypothetical protein
MKQDLRSTTHDDSLLSVDVKVIVVRLEEKLEIESVVNLEIRFSVKSTRLVG